MALDRDRALISEVENVIGEVATLSCSFLRRFRGFMQWSGWQKSSPQAARTPPVAGILRSTLAQIPNLEKDCQCTGHFWLSTCIGMLTLESNLILTIKTANSPGSLRSFFQ